MMGSLFVSCSKASAQNSASKELEIAKKSDRDVPKTSAKKAVSSESSSPVDTESAQQAAQVSAEIAKLGRVLSSLSARSKEAVVDGNAEEFLADLHKVLEAEKSFRTDDISLYYLIDKKHTVSSDYVPKDLVPLEKNDLFSISRNDLSLRPDVLESLKEMSRAALNDGIKLLVSSTYRSYSYQKGLFQHWVDVDGLEEAERESARPGTSQHQLGSAIDFGSITDDFGDTVMGKWLNNHAEEYGWSLSFPDGYEDVTGFRWECWHFRYVGKEACKFQRKWFSDVQQVMIEFIDAWKKESE